MPRRFEIQVKRARVTISQMSTADMWEIGNAFTEQMKRRILNAKTIEDIDAKPLTDKYKKRKVKKTPFLVRNLRYSGDMLQHMRVVRVDQNTAHIFFSPGGGKFDPVRRMIFNQRRSMQWGVSPSDAEYLRQYVDKKVKFLINPSRENWETLVAA
jgi:hypothetical protein